jgi:hypothetical protein
MRVCACRRRRRRPLILLPPPPVLLAPSAAERATESHSSAFHRCCDSEGSVPQLSPGTTACAAAMAVHQVRLVVMD